MGCWNGTCFLSGMSIKSGDPIRLQLILSSSIGKDNDDFDPEKFTSEDDPRAINGVCYANDIYSPFGFAISGEYNDYGSIENIKDNMASKILKEILNNYIISKNILMKRDVDAWIGRKDKNKKNEKLFVDIDVNKLDAFIDAVERGQVVVRTFRGNWKTLRFVMMAESMYENTLKQAYSVDWGWEDKTVGDYLKIFGESVVKFYSGNAGEFSTFIKDNEKILGHDYDTFERMREYVGKVKSNDPTGIMMNMLARESLWRPFSRDGVTWHDVSDSFMGIFDAGDEATKRAIIDVNVERSILSTMLSKLRMTWGIMGGCGSQDDNYDEIVAHAKNIIASVKNVKKMHKERYGE